MSLPALPARFQPQKWIHDNAVDSADPVDFDAGPAFLRLNGALATFTIAQARKDSCRDLDMLAQHPDTQEEFEAAGFVPHSDPYQVDADPDDIEAFLKRLGVSNTTAPTDADMAKARQVYHSMETALAISNVFPNYDLLSLPNIPLNFTCAIWPGDPCPTFCEGRPEAPRGGEMFLTIDYADPAERRFPDRPRFALELITVGGSGREAVIAAEDWETVKAAIDFIDTVRIIGREFALDKPVIDYRDSAGCSIFPARIAADFQNSIDAAKTNPALDPAAIIESVWSSMGVQDMLCPTAAETSPEA